MAIRTTVERAGALAGVKRQNRRPAHHWQIEHKPWVIQPVCIAPVLPGETLKNMMFQSRVVTDPILNPLVGWWIEYYWFYVKHRDLPGRDDFAAMMLDPDKDMSAYKQTVSHAVSWYTAIGGIKWTAYCLQRVVEEYFRNEGEEWDDFTINGLPVASIGQSNWLDSTINDTDFVIDDPELVVGVDDLITGSEIEDTLLQWQHLQGAGLTNMTYEDFLATYGVRGAEAQEPHKPELIRYVRDWSYPTNTIDPADGSPSTAVSWAISERADKDRFFREPGFIFGVTVARPKVYLNTQEGSVASFMQDALSWLPAVMMNDWRVSMKKFTAGAGPLPANTDAYWVDVRDLLLYGEQFVNYDISAVETASGVALPTVGLNKSYASAADALNLWADQVTPNEKIKQDGVVSFTIASHQRDQSATIASI